MLVLNEKELNVTMNKLHKFYKNWLLNPVWYWIDHIEFNNNDYELLDDYKKCSIDRLLTCIFKYQLENTNQYKILEKYQRHHLKRWSIDYIVEQFNKTKDSNLIVWFHLYKNFNYLVNKYIKDKHIVNYKNKLDNRYKVLWLQKDKELFNFAMDLVKNKYSYIDSDWFEFKLDFNNFDSNLLYFIKFIEGFVKKNSKYILLDTRSNNSYDINKKTLTLKIWYKNIDWSFIDLISLIYSDTIKDEFCFRISFHWMFFRAILNKSNTKILHSNDKIDGLFNNLMDSFYFNKINSIHYYFDLSYKDIDLKDIYWLYEKKYKPYLNSRSYFQLQIYDSKENKINLNKINYYPEYSEKNVIRIELRYELSNKLFSFQWYNNDKNLKKILGKSLEQSSIKEIIDRVNNINVKESIIDLQKLVSILKYKNKCYYLNKYINYECFTNFLQLSSIKRRWTSKNNKESNKHIKLFNKKFKTLVEDIIESKNSIDVIQGKYLLLKDKNYTDIDFKELIKDNDNKNERLVLQIIWCFKSILWLSEDDINNIIYEILSKDIDEFSLWKDQNFKLYLLSNIYLKKIFWEIDPYVNSLINNYLVSI